MKLNRNEKVVVFGVSIGAVVLMICGYTGIHLAGQAHPARQVLPVEAPTTDTPYSPPVYVEPSPEPTTPSPSSSPSPIPPTKRAPINPPPPPPPTVDNGNDDGGNDDNNNSGDVHPGAFCDPHGAVGHHNGHTYTCKGPGQDRWRR